MNCNNGLSTNSQIGFMKAINVAKKGSVPVAESERDYRWMDIAELVAKYQIKGGVNSRNCKEITEWVPSPCGCGKKMQTRTVCQECACMPKLPEHERGLVITVHDYEEIMRVKFPKEVVKITRIVVDGEEQEPSGELTNTSALEDYFRSILGATAKVQYTGGKIRITTDKALKDFEYEVNGDGNHALFNKKDTRTIELGTNNFYLFETTFDGTGRWVKYEIPTFSASDISYDGSETNVQDAIDKAKETAGQAKVSANNANKKATEAKDLATEAKATADGIANSVTEANNKADEALAKANEAKNTANTANNTANTAKSTADNAKTTADNAQSTANEANQKADDLATKVAALENATTTNTLTNDGLSITSTVNGTAATVNLADAVNSAIDEKIANFTADTNTTYTLDYYTQGGATGIRLTDSDNQEQYVQFSHQEVVELTANTPKVIEHNLGTRFITYTAFDDQTGEEPSLQVVRTGDNEITVTSTKDITISIKITR